MFLGSLRLFGGFYSKSVLQIVLSDVFPGHRKAMERELGVTGDFIASSGTSVRWRKCELFDIV